MTFGLALPEIALEVPSGISLLEPTASLSGAGPWQLAQELLALGVLQEDDWCGELRESISAGLMRWVHVTLGAGRMRIFAPLKLSLVNDASLYYLRLDDRVWRKEMSAVDHWPIGFFGLHWEQPASPIFVADKVQELERLFPGLGYGLLDLLKYAFRWTGTGLSFADALSYVEAVEAEAIEEAHGDWLDQEIEAAGPEWLDEDGSPNEEFEEALVDRWEQISTDPEWFDDQTTLTEGRFHTLIPPATHTTRMDTHLLPAACREVEGVDIAGFENGRAVGVKRRNNSKMTAMQREKRRYLSIVTKIFNLAQDLNYCARTHIGASHLPLFGNHGVPLQSLYAIYLSWHPEDEMHRVNDDFQNQILRYPTYGENAGRQGATQERPRGDWMTAYQTQNHQTQAQEQPAGDDTTDHQSLIWQHGFQLAHDGKTSSAAEFQQCYIALMRSDLSSTFHFQPDGSLASAVASTAKCVQMCILIDEILQWLQDPEDEAIFRRGGAPQFEERIRVRV